MRGMKRNEYQGRGEKRERMGVEPKKSPTGGPKNETSFLE
jgi:hypothetical protein